MRCTAEPNPALGWSQAPLAELLRLAWPLALSMLSYSVMMLVDTLFVARLGAAPLAGVGIAGTALWALICFPFGLLQGAKVLVSQAAGAGQPERAGAFLGAALAWAVGLGLALLALAGPVVAALPWLSAGQTAAAASQEYMRVRLLGVPLFFVFCALREVRQGLGDSRSPMWASVSANGLNIALDYAFIVLLGWGVAGAAAATALCNGVELAVLLALQARHGFGLRRTRPAHLRALWQLGWPTGLQFVIEMGCFTVLAVMISRYSELHMAAHQIAIQVIHFSFLPAVALGEAASVLAGQAVGTRREELVVRVARLALAVGALYTGACALILLLGGGAISGAFAGEQALRGLTTRLLWLAAAFQVFDAANIVGRGVLKGTGDVRYPAAVGTAVAWLFTPPSMWLLGYGLGLGALGGWIGISLELAACAGLFWWRLERGGFRAAMARARALREGAA